MNIGRSWFPCPLVVATFSALLVPVALRAAGCGQIKLDATDAVAAAPGNHRVILENDTVRVLEASVPLHATELPHTHFWPSVFFEQTSGVKEPWKIVKIRWSPARPSKGYVDSDHDRHNLLVELKTVDCQPLSNPELPATDAASIRDPNIAVILENEYVRVLSIRTHPGEKDQWHTHTWPAVTVHFGMPASQRLLPDGTKIPQPGTQEMRVTFDPGSQPLHSIENVGAVINQGYRIEIKPTMKVKLAKPAN